MNPVELFIARRYLTAKRSLRFINVIGYVSITGISAGVAALLIALSVFNGFSGVVTSVLVGFDPHVRIEKKGNISTAGYDSISGILANVSGVTAWSPYVAGKAMLSARSSSRVVFLKGVDPARIGEVTGLKKKIVLGSVSLDDTIGIPGVVIGLALADRLGSIEHDDIFIYSPAGIQSSLSGLTAPQGVKHSVTGIFQSDNKDYDADYAFIGLHDAQQLFAMEGKYSGVEMRLADFNDAEKVKEILAAQLKDGYTVSTWYDLHRSLYTVMMIERWSAYVLLSLIIMVATFNMLGSLTMGVIEKRRDIAVLKSMGMTSSSIIRLFMVEGMIIGVIGTIVGVVIGLLVLWLQIHFQLFRLDTSIYIIPAIPVEIHWMDFVSISAASLGLSFLAAWYPARRAAETLSAVALRWE
jgi:lipoprotein-releasing system permease protein